MTELLFPGVAIAMDRRDWIVPALTIGQLRRLSPELRRIKDMRDGADIDHDAMASMVKIIGTALRRNYSDLTDEALEEMLDLGNLNEILLAVLGRSGVRPAAAGEARAATGNGIASMGSSPPLSIGRTIPLTG